MNCADLRRLLAFDDATLAPDPIALRAHLSACAACRRQHFDLAALFCVESARTRVPALRGFAFVGAAAALLLAIGIALVRVAPDESNAVDASAEHTAAVSHRMLPRAETSQVTKQVSMLSGGRRVPMYSISQSTSGPTTRSSR